MNTLKKNNLIYASILFLYLLISSLFQISNTPLFENFDEMGHFSAIRQLAYEENIPNRENSFVDINLVEYSGPIHFNSGNPPFDSGLVYKKFFEKNTLLNYNETYNINEFPAYQRSKIANVEFQQHPVGYYLLLSKFYYKLKNISKCTSFFTKIIFLNSCHNWLNFRILFNIEI
jgi:hypothetical protein